MRIWFLCKVKYAKETEEGLLKSISEQYLVDAVSFTEAEAILYDRLGSQIRGDFQVSGISKSNIVDVFFYDDADIWYKCKVTYLIADGDNGKGKKGNPIHDCNRGRCKASLRSNSRKSKQHARELPGT